MFVNYGYLGSMSNFDGHEKRDTGWNIVNFGAVSKMVFLCPKWVFSTQNAMGWKNKKTGYRVQNHVQMSNIIFGVDKVGHWTKQLKVNWVYTPMSIILRKHKFWKPKKKYLYKFSCNRKK